VTFDIVTIFPAMIDQALAAGVLGRGNRARAAAVKVRDLRDLHRQISTESWTMCRTAADRGWCWSPIPIFSRRLDSIELDVRTEGGRRR